jgi:hypothetical protein
MMSSKKKAGKKAAGPKKARLRDLPRKARGQEELTEEQARKVKGGAADYFLKIDGVPGG